MIADEIRQQRETLAAAEPFAQLAEAARAMIIHLESVEACAEQVRDGLTNGFPRVIDVGVVGTRKHVLDGYRKCADELHAAVDRVMRTALIDGADAAEERLNPKPIAKEPSDA